MGRGSAMRSGWSASRTARCALALGLLAIGWIPLQPASLAAQGGADRFVTVNAPSVAITNVVLVDGTGAPAQRGQTVLVRDGRIAAIGGAGEVLVPSNTTIIDGAGRSLMPGMVMLHEHMFYPAGGAAYTQQEFSFPRLYLAAGVTTARTGGSRDPFGDLNLKAAIDGGRVPGPNLDVSGPYLNGPGMPILFMHALDGPAEASEHVSYWADRGATSFKAYMQISRDELRAGVAEAHSRGIKVTGHLCSVTYREAADLGIDDLEHGLFASTDFVPNKEPDTCPSGADRTRSLMELDVHGAEATDLIRHLVDRGVALTSTLTVFEISTPGRPAAPAGALDAMEPGARERYMTRWEAVQSRPDAAYATLFPKAMAFEKAFADAGGLLVAGTDPTGYGGVVAGYANQRQVELLAEAGFTPEEAISISSLNGARYLGIESETGSIAVGKVADLVLVEGDLSRDISAIREPVLTFKAGVGYDSPSLFAAVKGTVGIR